MDFVIGDLQTPPSQLVVTWSSSNAALVPEDAISMTGADALRHLTLVNIPVRIGTSWITLTVSDGELSASTSFRATVRPMWDYYLPEGSTAGATTDIRVTNPHEVAAPIRITFVRDDGVVMDRTVTVPPTTRHSISVNGMPEAGTAGVSAFIRSLDNLPLLVERTMIWGAGGYGGHAETALESTNRQWFFADGAQTDGLWSRLILANPNFESVQVRVDFLLGGAGPTRTYTLAPLSRRVIELGGIAELRQTTFGMIVDADLPIVAERVTYLDGPRQAEGGSVATGAPFPSTTWYFGEGSGWRTFSSYVLLANPGVEAAAVIVEYFTATGAAFTSTHNLAGRSRLTVDSTSAEPRLEGEHYWMRVTSSQPIVAERSMYWDRSVGRFTESHASRGLYAPALRWVTGDARVGGPEAFNTFLLIGHPNDRPASVRITYYPDTGGPIVTIRQMAPWARDTVHVNLAAPQILNDSFWALIESTNDTPVVVERSVYWNGDGERWAAGTNVTALPVLPASHSGCEFVVSPARRSLPATGGVVEAQVGATTRCTYTVTTTDGWLILPAERAGSGVGTFTITATSNAGPARTGTVVVAGQQVTIWQAGGTDPQCLGGAPGDGWVCINGGWIPPDHPLLLAPPPPPASVAPPAAAPSQPSCATPSPGDGWGCLNGGWLPPGHPALDSAPDPSEPGADVPPLPPPVAPAPEASTCATPAPGEGWGCLSGGWLPPGHPALLISTPPPGPPAPPAGTGGVCLSPRPGVDWVCMNGGWIPPGHPALAGGPGGA